MRITQVYIRFYKSFNYDYERKFHRRASPDFWEHIDGAWYPYVRMPLESSISTIVGANESGKSHLLDSIEHLITGRPVTKSDFCRYSRFFSVEKDQRRLPDFGGEFEAVTTEDIAAADRLGLTLQVGERFKIFRQNGGAALILGPGATDLVGTEVAQEVLDEVLPRVVRLDPDVPLPASIPLFELRPGSLQQPVGSRRVRNSVMSTLFGGPVADSDDLARRANAAYEVLESESQSGSGEQDLQQRQYQLGRDLLFLVAKVDPSTFRDLSEAISSENEGYVNGIIQQINQSLAANLNFPRWWAQDREFSLLVSPREHELVFTIRDRTGTDYSFGERSNGLRYFLSYHVQLLAHQRPADGRTEILLMDEPDAYLSSQGQQDLLKILEEFSQPTDQSRIDQVVYVTHSPFLINRNRAERIRVLDKGEIDEGTRVVKDASRNHYEPLRSSLGSFVAETSFIGGSNLFVEGLADQVLLAGVNAHLISAGYAQSNVLDLNEVTIVPAGSASSVPYLVFLARGRDVTKPPAVALLDSDEQGNQAVKTLQRGGDRNKQVLRSEFVHQVGGWADHEFVRVDEEVRLLELEDLIPISVAVAAANSYHSRFQGNEGADDTSLSEQVVRMHLPAKNGSLFKAIEAAYSEIYGEDAHLDKVGLAKELVALLPVGRSEQGVVAESRRQLEGNFAAILGDIAKSLRSASLQERARRLNDRLGRAIKGFLVDFPTSATRERGRLLVEEVHAFAEETSEGDQVRAAAEGLRRDFRLDEDLNDPIDSFDEFRTRVQGLQYEERFAKREAAETRASHTAEGTDLKSSTTRKRPPKKKSS